MIRLSTTAWEIAAWLAGAAALGTGAYLYLTRKRPSAAELEHARRHFLVHSGRIVDGMLLDVCEIDAADGGRLTMLLFNYRIGGVDYECSQDITVLRGIVDVVQIRAGFPCSVRYQPGTPQNSIVVAEEWSGLRMGLPVLRARDEPDAVEPVPPQPKTARPKARRAKAPRTQAQS
jgi:hypothetical protein